MTEDLARAELDHAERSEGLVSKGLAAGRIGTFTGAVLGISTVAPGYTLTASIGLIVAAVGLKMPAILIAGFIPMFLTAYAYRELNSRAPDCGASFTWSTKAFGPYVGWMCGWGMVIATIIVLSNLASIGVQYGYQFLGAVTHNQTVAELANYKAVNIISTVALLAIATYISSRGITTSEKVQYVLVGFQMIVLVLFAVVAIVKAPGAAGHLDFDLDWFNPMTGLTLSAFVIGLVGSIFAFWGWDTCLTLGEESKDPTKVPGRAGLLCVLSILLTYLLVAVAVMMFAGIGDTDLGLANENNKDNVFGALANPVLGSWFGPLLLLAIFASAIASLQTTSLPAARTMLAMGTYGAFRNSSPVSAPLPHPHVQHRGGRRRHRGVLHDCQPALRPNPAGYHCRPWHHDLLVLRHHRLRLCVVLPRGTVPKCPQPGVQVPVSAAGRSDAGGGLRDLRSREHGPREDRQRCVDRRYRLGVLSRLRDPGIRGAADGDHAVVSARLLPWGIADHGHPATDGMSAPVVDTPFVDA